MNDEKNTSTNDIRTLPAGRGLAWLLQSLSLIRSQPARLLFLAVLLQLILGLSQVPVIGMLVVVALPAFSAGLLEAFRRVETGGLLPASILFVPLTQKPANGRFLLLGVAMFALAALSAMLVLGGSDTQLDPELIQQIEQGNAEALSQLDPELTMKVLLAALLAVSLSGTISYLAIPLIWFHGLPVGKALVLGLQGLMRNWKPFLVLGLGLMVMLLPLLAFFAMMLGLASAFSPVSLLFAVLVMLSGLLFQLVVLGTQYFAYKDIFGVPAGQEMVKPGDNDPQEGQLLA